MDQLFDWAILGIMRAKVKCNAREAYNLIWKFYKEKSFTFKNQNMNATAKYSIIFSGDKFLT